MLFFLMADAQIQQGGLPISLTDYNTKKIAPVIFTPNTNVSALRQEDESVDQIKDIPWRYGYIHYVDVSLEDGVFETLANGDRLWRAAASMRPVVEGGRLQGCRAARARGEW